MAEAQNFSQIGPDQKSVHTARPYFVLPIPILQTTDDEAMRRARGDYNYIQAMHRIQDWMSKADKPYSDVYVLSHGWHRNYYGAVSSYDRLVSRMTRLRMRERLPEPKDYNPLFICVHWSSEVGKDVWTDLAGRRHKPEFLQLARDRFKEELPKFQNIMEDAFEFFSAVSAPDSTFDPVLGKKSDEIANSFLKMRLQEESSESPDDKLLPSRIAAAWSCYHEAQCKGVRGTQKLPPQPFANFILRWTLLIKFIIGVLGVAMIIGLQPVRDLVFRLTIPIRNAFEWLVDKMPEGHSFLRMFYAGLLSYLAIGIGATLLFLIAAKTNRWYMSRKAAFKVGWITGGLWLLTEVAFAIPLVISLLLQYLLSWTIFHRTLFSERRRLDNKYALSLNYPLSSFARFPNRVLDSIVSPESFWAALSRAIDSQLAFFDMQRRGVTSAFLASEAIATLKNHSTLKGARLHLAGHSFGGLLVANIARELARADQNKWGDPIAVETLCSIEGAFASGWLGIESKAIENVNSTVASIFSEADSATGFYYPASNAGRLAAGSVGFSEIRISQKDSRYLPQAGADNPCRYGCVLDHVHRPLPYASLADPPVLQGLAEQRAIFNIDGSKMIYEGPIGSGGGHSDIYKDDVVLLLWAVLHRREMLTRWPPHGTPKQEATLAGT